MAAEELNRNPAQLENTGIEPSPKVQPSPQKLPKGLELELYYRSQGFSEDEINTWKFERTQDYKKLGFSDEEIAADFGVKAPELDKVKNYIESNLNKVYGPQPLPTTKQAAEQGSVIQDSPAIPKPDPASLPNPRPPEEIPAIPQKQAQSLAEAFAVGYGFSAAGLERNGKLPDTVVAEDAPRFYKVAQMLGTAYGDSVLMAAGSIAGAPIGAEVGAAVGSLAGPGGTVVGAGVGALMGGMGTAFALPEAFREAYIQNYVNGSIENFKDFWDHTSAIFLKTLKAFGTGAATGVVGGAAKMLPIVSPVAKGLVVGSSEVATMVTVGSALDKHVPKFDDFMNAAILVGGFHGAGAVMNKLMITYVKKGFTPGQIVEDIRRDPTIKQDLLSDNIDVPTSYQKVASTELPAVIEKAPVLPKVEQPEVTPEMQHILDGIKSYEPETQSTFKNIIKYFDELKARADLNDNAELKQFLLDFKQNFTDRYSNLSELTKNLIDAKLKSELDPIDYAMKKAIESLDREPTTQLKLNDILLPADKNPYLAGRMSTGWISKSQFAFTKGGGAFDYKTGKVLTRSATEILAPVKNDIRGFDGWRVAKRVVELDSRGIKTRFDVEKAKAVVKQGQAKYEKIAEEWLDFRNKHLDYLVDSGVLDPEVKEAMVEANKAHVSFKKVVSDWEKSGKPTGLGFLKAIRDSELSLEQPLISELANIQAIYRAADINRTKLNLIELAKSVPDQDLLFKVGPDFTKTKITAKETGVEAVAPLLEVFGIESKADLDVFRSKTPQAGEGQFSVFVNGKREVWQTKDPLVAESINLLNGEQLPTSIFFKLAAAFTSIKKLGITLTPEYQLRNPIRDFFTREIATKTTQKTNPLWEMLKGNGYQPLHDVLEAMGDVVFKRQAYLDALKSGALSNTFLDFHKDFIEPDFIGINKKTGFLDAVWNTAKTPLDILHLTGTILESGTRVATFKETLNGKQDARARIEAGIAAKESTVDFDKRGAKMATLSAMTAFQSVTISALSRFAEAMSADPKGVTLRAMAAVTVPALMSWWLNKDDDRYKTLANWRKGLFIPIITNDWQKVNDPSELNGVPPTLIRQNENGEFEVNKGINWLLPMPQEVMVLFGAFPVMIADRLYSENPRAFDDFGRLMSQSFLPGIIPDWATAALEPIANYNFFTGNPIIPEHLKGLLPIEQFQPYTTETAKEIGKLVPIILSGDTTDKTQSLSPLIVENVTRNLAGPLGMYTLQLMDAALAVADPEKYPPGPEKNLQDYPLFRGVTVKYPSTSAQPVEDFYKRAEEMQKLQNTVKKMMGENNPAYLDIIESNQDKMVNVQQVKSEIAALRKMMNFVTKNPQFSPSDQRQMLDTYSFLIIQRAEHANAMFDAAEKIFKEAKKAAEEKMP